MAITRTLFRAKAVSGKTASQIVGEINKELCTDNDNAMFVTFFLGMLELETGNIEFCNAGHNYPYILRNDCSLEKLNQTHGTPLGLFDTVKYKSGTTKLNKTETIVLYTDGIPEAMDINQNLLGDEKLEEMLEKTCHHRNPKEITNILLDQTCKFATGAEQSDDITILVLTYFLDKQMQQKHLEIQNRIADINKVEVFVEQFCREWNIQSEEMLKINLALEEIISNIINYGYRDNMEHTIHIETCWYNSILKIIVKDDATAFNPLTKKDPDDLDKPLEDRNIGGLGIFFVKKMMDKVNYRYENKQNILIIEKMIAAKQF